ncbi:MAG: purine-binding chemotaxis protein CheW [Deltaproteobacteria bacterium]|nr:purine-binding chemotaxis protein CheW [Deltaproteobacteria bacterium]
MEPKKTDAAATKVFPKAPPSRSLSELLEELARRQELAAEKPPLTADEVRAVLTARARQLSPAAAPVVAGELLEILEFTLGPAHYAFPLPWVREVCHVGEITQIPGTPAFVKGIVNLRSRICSVIDLGQFLGLPGLSETVAAESRLLVLASREMEFAVLIDRLVGVRSLPGAELQARLPTLAGVQAEYFKGVTADRLVLLDAEKLLTDKKIAVQ